MVPQGLTPMCHKMYITVANKFTAGGGKGRQKSTAVKKRSTGTAAPTSTGEIQVLLSIYSFFCNFNCMF